MFDAACSRLRLGGSISGSVLSGGTVIDSGGIAISTRSGMYGFSGYKGQNPQLIGSDGQYHRTRKPIRAKTLTLNLRAYGRDATGVVTTSVGEHLEANMDEILQLIAGAGEQVILERDMEDGSTRWIRIQPLVEALFVEGAFFNPSMGSYDFPVICTAAYPFWQSETEHSEVIAVGSDTIPNLGNARIGNAKYTFAGAGSFTNDDNGDKLVATAACLVDVGLRQISNAGSPTPGRLDPPNRSHWIWLSDDGGTTNVTVTGSQVTVEYRDHWH